MSKVKKLATMLLVFATFISIFGAGGIAVSEKIKLVILPGKVGTGWNMDEVDYLLAILEEQALELGRFQIFPRGDLQQIMKERNLTEFGISEAIEIGKIGGSKYALLLTLTELTSSWSSKLNMYEAVTRYTIKLYNVENGELLASKTMTSAGSSKDTSQKAITAALNSTASSIWLELRNIFKIEAYVKNVEDGEVLLAGIDPRIAKKGYIFKIETDTEPAYVKVIGYDKIENAIVAKFMYGGTPKIYDVAIEYPTLPISGGVGFSIFSGKFGIGVTGWTEANEETPIAFHFALGTFLGNILGFSPAYVNFGLDFNLIQIGRMGAHINGGLSIIGLIDMETFEPVNYIYGIFAGGLLTYEMNPSFGFYGSLGYSLYIDNYGPTGLTLQLGVYF
ncbi:MAG: hypothetical protein ACK4R7_01570 [Fervidobacterium sp.]